jgi:hypothetical protein
MFSAGRRRTRSIPMGAVALSQLPVAGEIFLPLPDWPGPVGVAYGL